MLASESLDLERLSESKCAVIIDAHYTLKWHQFGKAARYAEVCIAFRRWAAWLVDAMTDGRRRRVPPLLAIRPTGRRLSWLARGSGALTRRRGGRGGWCTPPSHGPRPAGGRSLDGKESGERVSWTPAGGNGGEGERGKRRRAYNGMHAWS